MYFVLCTLIIVFLVLSFFFFFLQEEEGIGFFGLFRGLGDVNKKKNPEIPAGKKRGGFFKKKSRHSPPEVSLRPFSQTISRQHLHPGKEPPAVGKAYFTIESAKHSH